MAEDWLDWITDLGAVRSAVAASPSVAAGQGGAPRVSVLNMLGDGTGGEFTATMQSGRTVHVQLTVTTAADGAPVAAACTAPASRRETAGDPQPAEGQPSAVTPDQLVKGTVIRIPAGGRRRPYCLDIISRDTVSKVTGAVRLTGTVLGANGTTARRRPLLRTVVVMPQQVTIVRTSEHVPGDEDVQGTGQVPLTEVERAAVQGHRCPRCGTPRLNRCRGDDGTILEHPHPERTAKVTAGPSSRRQD